MAASPDVLVIGAGVLGAATARALAEAGARVDVVDAGEAAAGVSAATFAVDVTRVKTPRLLYDLAVDAGREHAALAAELGGEPWRHPAASLEWGDAPADRERLRERVARLVEWGHAAQWISRDDAVALEPALALPDGGPEEIVLFPDGAWYEPDVLVQALLERARARGARVHLHDPVVEVDARRGAVNAVRTRGGRTFAPDVLVNCAGPDAASVAALAGAELPLRRVPGVVAWTKATALRLRTIVHAGDLNFRPDRRGRVGMVSWIHDAELGEAEGVGDATRPALRMLERGRALLPGLARVGLAEARVGIRPVPHDGLPLVGFIEGVENLYALVAHSGVHLAPLLGRLAARDLLGGGESRLEPFRPSRSPTDGSGPLDESTQVMLARLRAGAAATKRDTH